jgi:Flp pilus assembly protein protease CpaA
VPHLRSILFYLVAVALGVATMAGIAHRWLPHGVIAVAFALFFILLLARRPRFVAAYCAGAALAVGFTFVAFMNPGWDNCADEVGGELIEYKCSEGQPTR